LAANRFAVAILSAAALWSKPINPGAAACTVPESIMRPLFAKPDSLGRIMRIFSQSAIELRECVACLLGSGDKLGRLLNGRLPQDFQHLPR
jgi:hypothetical protein